MQVFFSSSLAYCANYLESLLIVVITNEFNNIEKKIRKLMTIALNVAMQQRRDKIDCCVLTILNPIFVNTY